MSKYLTHISTFSVTTTAFFTLTLTLNALCCKSLDDFKPGFERIARKQTPYILFMHLKVAIFTVVRW